MRARKRAADAREKRVKSARYERLTWFCAGAAAEVTLGAACGPPKGLAATETESSWTAVTTDATGQPWAGAAARAVAAMEREARVGFSDEDMVSGCAAGSI